MLTLGLSACSTVSGLPRPDDLYPTALTACQDEPKVPSRPAPGQPRPDAVKGQYIKDLRGAWADCHDTVAATKTRKDLYQHQYDTTQGTFWDKLFHRHAK